MFTAIVTLSILVHTLSSPISNSIANSTSPISEMPSKKVYAVFWCPNPNKENCRREPGASTWRQLGGGGGRAPFIPNNVAAAALGAGLGAGLGASTGGLIGSLSLLGPIGGSIAGGLGGGFGGGAGGGALGGQGGAIGGALGGALGGNVGGVLGAPGGLVGGLIGGGLGGGLGAYYLSNTTYPALMQQINNSTVTPVLTQAAGNALNSSVQAFLSDVLLIGPEEDVISVLVDYEEDLTT